MSYTIFNAADRPQIDRLRRKARRLGLRLEKSRQSYHVNNQGGLQLTDVDRNAVVAGCDYSLGLSAAGQWIDRFAAQ